MAGSFVQGGLNALANRRKRTGPKPAQPVPAPGTPAFGDMARSRRDRLINSAEAGDLRVQTAYKKARRRKNQINSFLQGD